VSVRDDDAGVRLSVSVLGTLRVRLADREIRLGTRMQRSVFAILALRANQIVSRSELVDALWGERPPATAPGNIYSYITGLRQALGEHAHMLESSRAGYCLRLTGQDLDASQFDYHYEAARALRDSGNPEEAIVQFDAALGLCGEVPLADVTGPFAEAERNRLDSRRMDVTEQRTRTVLGLGRMDDAQADALNELGTRHPLRESLQTLRMQALHQVGRTAEALTCYDQLRKLLASELGVDPGPDCERTHAELVAAARRSSGTRIVPEQLPTDVRHFVGRDRELSELTREAVADGHSRTVVITAINGIAGVGKTALAVHLAHRLRDRYPDGRLYVNLRGFEPRSAPMPPAEALDKFLRALGADPQALPFDEAGQSALYRSMVAQRRLLIVLDNAANAQQVRPLLPGSPTSMVLITSRNSLGALAARDGAQRISLDTLSDEEATELMTSLLAESGVLAEPSQIRELAELCSRLPLALRVAAQRTATGADAALSDVLEQLRDEIRRLDALTSNDDPANAVRAVFSWSFRALAPEVTRLFRLLGLHPDAEVSSLAAAAISGSSAKSTRRHLDVLTRANLIEPIARDRYRMHDLLRIYATELVQEIESQAEHTAALTRMFDWYLESADAANRVIDPLRPRWQVKTPGGTHEAASFTSRPEAISWCETHLSTYVAATRKASELDMDYAWRLPGPFVDVLNLRRHNRQWLEMFTIGIEAARRAAIDDAEMRLRTGIVYAYMYLGDFDRARQELEAAREWWAVHEPGSWYATTLQGLAFYWYVQGELDKALDLTEQALEICRAETDWWGIGWTLNNLGVMRGRGGELATAYHYLSEALHVCSEHGHLALGYAYLNIISVHLRFGNFSDAAGLLDQAINDSGRIDAAVGAMARWFLARVALSRDQRNAAIAYVHYFLEQFESIGISPDPESLAAARRLLADLEESGPNRPSFTERVITEFRAQGGTGDVGYTLRAETFLLLTYSDEDSFQKTTPITFIRAAGQLIVFANKLADLDELQWAEYVLKRPGCQVELGTERFNARALLATGPERENLFNAAVEQRPFLLGHDAEQGHEMLLFMLERQ
jgi:DNA-binding SARP family transcriptional activator/Tfp pilus assembly protein PilF